MPKDSTTKWYITGYAMHTVAGNESNFDCKRTIGYTKSIDCNWTRCIDSSEIQLVYKCIKETIERALKIANLSSNSNEIRSLVIASNFFENKFSEINTNNSIYCYENHITILLKKTYNINGPTICNSTACSSGASAVITACQIIDDHQADIAIVVGYDIESEIPKNGMKRIGAISKDKIAPFSYGRTGTDLADGVGVLIIESYNSIKERTANVVASIVGYGSNNDAFNPTMPEPSGISLIKAMQNSIKMSNVPINEIKYINAHGSGTKANDILETKAIKEVFKDHAFALFINSSKSLIGHTLGAAGIIEIIITIIQMNQEKIHPTANFLGYNNECDLNYCFEKSIDCKIKYAISNSIGFGGTNVCILLKK